MIICDDIKSRRRQSSLEFKIVSVHFIKSLTITLMFMNFFSIHCCANRDSAAHRLNMELDLQSWAPCAHCTQWLRPRNRNPRPRAFGLIYEGAIGQPR
jgi:hypothetical protein